VANKIDSFDGQEKYLENCKMLLRIRWYESHNLVRPSVQCHHKAKRVST